LRWRALLGSGAEGIRGSANIWVGDGPDAGPIPPEQRASAIAVFGHAALQPRIAATVFAWAKTGVAGNLTTIVKAMAITNLPIDHYAGHLAQSTRLVWSGSVLQLQREDGDLFL